VEVKGYLGHRGDVDAFRIDAPAGTVLHAQLALPAGIDARVQIGEEEPKPAKPEFEVKGGDVVRLMRIDPVAEKGDKPALPGLNDPYRIFVR
jgi:hypothetical protein